MKRILLFLLTLALIFSATGCGNDVVPDSGKSTTARTEASQAEPLPADDWKFDTPENQGMDPARLEQLHDALKESGVTSMVVVRNGFIVNEYYKDGYDENSVFSMNSCTKSVTSALIGIALAEGLIDSIDVKISEYFPQINESGSIDQKEITIRHLLEHTSGIEWPEWGGLMFLSFAFSKNWVEFVLSQPMATKPGTAFNYTTGGTHLLAAILEQVTEKGAYEFAIDRLLGPLGIRSAEFRTDPQGILDGGSGMSVTSRDAAKFGQLYLQNGSWNGRQLVPAAWVAQSTKRHTEGNNFGQYGYQWWVKELGGHSTYFAEGYGGQYILVVPSLALVTVFTCNNIGNVSLPQVFLADYILAACSETAR